VNVDNLNVWIILQVLAQLGDIDIHRTGVEVVVINPDGLECEVTLQYLVGMAAEEGEQFVLLGLEHCLLITEGEELLLCVE